MAKASQDLETLDLELEGLPAELRWREWMTRVEAVLFASSEPVSRETLARVVSKHCSIELLIDDVKMEMAGRAFEIAKIAGGWQFRTKPRHGEVLRVAFETARSPVHITASEMVVLASIAYHQPITRGALANITGRDVSRDIIGRLREMDLIGSGPRAPEPGAPYSYVTTKKFLSYFGLDTIRDLPDIEGLDDAGLTDGKDATVLPIAGVIDGSISAED